MWETVSEYESAGIRASSLKSQRSKIKDDYSLGIFFGTYESRGLLSTRLLASKCCRQSIVVFFKESKDHILRKKNDRLLLERVRECSEREPIVIQDMSVSRVEEILSSIIKKVPRAAFSSGSRWFIDMAGSPKPYFLGICAYVRRMIGAPALTFFHASGDYERGNALDDAYSFTDGFDRYMWVPFLWGRPDRTRSWTYFFLLGFEGNRSLDIWERFEPKHAEAVIGNPGYKPEYVKIAKRKNAHFLRRAKPKILFADAADAVQAWRKLDARISKVCQKSNVCLVPLGTKPHALASALVALANCSSSVMYLMPRSFAVRDIHPGKFVWLYKVSF